MPVSPWLLGVPDTSGDIFLANVNGNFMALATCSASSSEPPVKAAGMFWLDLNEGRVKQRNQTNSQWVPIFALRNNQCIPLRAGEELTNISTLQPNADGYVRCKNGVFLLESIDSPDVPMFGVNRSGIVPGVTTAQSNQKYVLKSDSSWEPPGPRRMNTVNFAGAKEYAMAVPSAAHVYTLSIECKLSGRQTLVLQIGAGGSPTQQNYFSRASRNTPTDIYGDLNEPSVSSDKGFVLFKPYASNSPAITFRANCTLTNPVGNTWFFTSMAIGAVGGQQGTIDSSVGTVNINGQLNYIRALSGGTPLGSFNLQDSIDVGYMTVFA